MIWFHCHQIQVDQGYAVFGFSWMMHFHKYWDYESIWNIKIPAEMVQSQNLWPFHSILMILWKSENTNFNSYTYSMKAWNPSSSSESVLDMKVCWVDQGSSCVISSLSHKQRIGLRHQRRLQGLSVSRTLCPPDHSPISIIGLLKILPFRYAVLHRIVKPKSRYLYLLLKIVILIEVREKKSIFSFWVNVFYSIVWILQHSDEYSEHMLCEIRYYKMYIVYSL